MRHNWLTLVGCDGGTTGLGKGGGCVTTGLPWLVVTEGQLDLVKAEVASQLALLPESLALVPSLCAQLSLYL